MSIIELHTSHNGEVAQLLIDGEDVSRKANGVDIQFHANSRPRATVTVHYKVNELQVSGNFELTEGNSQK